MSGCAHARWRPAPAHRARPRRAAPGTRPRTVKKAFLGDENGATRSGGPLGELAEKRNEALGHCAARKRVWIKLLTRSGSSAAGTPEARGWPGCNAVGNGCAEAPRPTGGQLHKSALLGLPSLRPTPALSPPYSARAPLSFAPAAVSAVTAAMAAAVDAARFRAEFGSIESASTDMGRGIGVPSDSPPAPAAGRPPAGSSAGTRWAPFASLRAGCAGLAPASPPASSPSSSFPCTSARQRGAGGQASRPSHARTASIHGCCSASSAVMRLRGSFWRRAATRERASSLRRHHTLSCRSTSPWMVRRMMRSRLSPSNGSVPRSLGPRGGQGKSTGR